MERRSRPRRLAQFPRHFNKFPNISLTFLNVPLALGRNNPLAPRAFPSTFMSDSINRKLGRLVAVCLAVTQLLASEHHGIVRSADFRFPARP